MMAIIFIRKKSIGEKFKFSPQWNLNLGWKYLPSLVEKRALVVVHNCH
jgi:hypothetical protein